MRINLQRAECCGLYVYRWAEQDDSGTYEAGEPTLDPQRARLDGESYAESADETPDEGIEIEAIVATHYYHDSGDIAGVIAYIESHESLGQGHVITSRSGQREWVTSGYVDDADALYVDIGHGGMSRPQCVRALRLACEEWAAKTIETTDLPAPHRPSRDDRCGLGRP